MAYEVYDVEDIITVQKFKPAFMARMQTLATTNGLDVDTVHRMFALWVHPNWGLVDLYFARANATAPVNVVWSAWKTWYINGRPGGPDLGEA